MIPEIRNPSRSLPGIRRAGQRRGNILLFVIFILGTLFVSSISFLTLMRTDSKVLSAEREKGEVNFILNRVSDELLSRAMLHAEGYAEIPVPDPADGDLLQHLERVPYLQTVRPGRDGVSAANADTLPQWTDIPGVHPWVASIEPYDSGHLNTAGVSDTPLNLEYFAATDLGRAWDNRPDVWVNANLDPDPEDQRFVPTTELGRPLRIRRLNEEDPPRYSYWEDRVRQDYEANGFLRDADGDGVVDSRLFRLSLLGGGEVELFSSIFTDTRPDGLPSNNDGWFLGYSWGNLSGAPSFTVPATLPVEPLRTPLPQDDFNGNGYLDFGTAFRRQVRRDAAKQMRDLTLQPGEPGADVDDDLYLAMRTIQNGGMVNINASFYTLVDNVLGQFLDDVGSAKLLAEEMVNLPYDPVGTEAYLRRRFLLPTLELPTSIDLGLDLSMSDDLRKMLTDHMVPFNSLVNQVQWSRILDEPGTEPAGSSLAEVFDFNFARRWMDPFLWRDPFAAGTAGIDYDVRHLLCANSTDDLLMRPGWYDPDGPDGPGVTTHPAVQLSDFVSPHVNALDISSGEDVPEAVGSPLARGIYPLEFRATDHQLGDQFGTLYGNSAAYDTALMMYPGYDPHYIATGAGDPSFTYIDSSGVRKPKVPSALANGGDPAGNRRFEVPRDPVTGRALDPRFGRMQFSLHSIGNIDGPPTPREVQTVLDYFTVMLRNVINFDPVSVAYSIEDDYAIHDQAAQLAANFVDFADSDQLPTELRSRTGKIYYGFERQPFISEVFLNGPPDPPNPPDPPPDPPLPTGTLWAVELFNPYPDAINLQTAGYALRVVNSGRTEVLAPIPLDVPNSVIAPRDFLYFASDHTNTSLAGDTTRGRTLPDLAFGAEIVQLLREVESHINGSTVYVVVDEFALENPSDTSNSLQRYAQVDASGRPDWRVVVPKWQELPPTFGAPNNVNLPEPPVAVHAITHDSGSLERAYPTTGSLLLLMRYAHREWVSPTNANNALALPMTQALGTNPTLIDNGHMPVFDQQAVAQKDWAGQPGALPMDQTTMLAIPWGQLVFDYFTSLPLEPRDGYRFKPNDPPYPFPQTNAGFADYLLHNQPTVQNGGLRVEGRININAAPWKVLQGLPCFKPGELPIYQTLPEVAGGLGTWTDQAMSPIGVALTEPAMTTVEMDDGLEIALEQLGRHKALGIVAYRELREILDRGALVLGGSPPPSAGNYNVLNYGDRVRADNFADPLTNVRIGMASVYQRHTAGFLTVGELANVRNRGTNTNLNPTLGAEIWSYNVAGSYQMDNGVWSAHAQDPTIPPDYLRAIAPLVALNDAWVTVKGHTFTTWAVLRGHGNKAEVDKQAMRFQMTWDRSNLLTTNDPNERPIVIYHLEEPY